MTLRPTKQENRVEQLIEDMRTIPDSMFSAISGLPHIKSEKSRVLIARDIVWSGAFWLELMWKGIKYNAQRRK